MPDDNPGEGIEQQPVQKSPGGEPVEPPATPYNPSPVDAKTVPKQGVSSEIQGIENQIRAAEKWMIGLTGAIVLLTAGIVIVGVLQWKTMSGQLAEMKSGGKDTHDLAVAAGKQADAATTANRAWMVVRGTRFGYLRDKAGIERASSNVVFINTGPSPAFHLHIWRCAQVRTTEPSVEVMPTDLPMDCDDTETGGMLGRDVPETMHINDVSQVVPRNSLVDNWRDVGKRFYAWGRITYDIYPYDGKSHFVSFCLANVLDGLTTCRNGNEGN